LNSIAEQYSIIAKSGTFFMSHPLCFIYFGGFDPEMTFKGHQGNHQYHHLIYCL